MIEATFVVQGDAITKVSVSGHANYAAHGEDIVCAAVTSAVQLTANGITQVLDVPAQITVLENEIIIALPTKPSTQAVNFLKALQVHLSLLASDYPEYIAITLAEV